MLQDPAATIVADIGARYGVHPSWSGFNAPLVYVAFEPDPEEAKRLSFSNNSSSVFLYRVEQKALDKTDGERDFYLLKHRGLSSFLRPDLSSECFKHFKPGEAELEKVISVRMHKLDTVFKELGYKLDFIKVDTEGTEQDVIEGSEEFLRTTILGIRSSCNFQPCFHGQKLFSETHDYLMKLGFFLLNLDYRGFGYPRLGLFRKPDPTEHEDYRYGILVAADAVWMLKPDVLKTRRLGQHERVFSILKMAYFALLNNAPDYGIDLLRELADEGVIDTSIRESHLYKAIRVQVALFLGRFRTVPDQYWLKARNLYKAIFSEELCGGSAFHPQISMMKKELDQLNMQKYRLKGAIL